jgi:parallel beta-helix repeat protein
LIDGKANNTIKNCIIKEFVRGIHLSYSFNITIIYNEINNNMIGLNLYSSSNNNISNNIFSENDQYDIFLSSTSCTNIIENNIGSGLAKNNLIKYFNYSVNLENETLSELILCGANYSSINNITISASPNKKNNGIILLYTSYTNITNSNSSFNNIGIRLEESSNNFIANNDLSNNNEGVFLSGSNNSITGNIINNNARGIGLSYSGFNPSFNNTITNNTINNNGEGIFLSGVGVGKMVQNTSIISNTISNNSYKGIYLYWADNTSIENNEILNNGYGIYSENSDSIINNNTVCGNTQYDFYSRNWLSSYGDNNTCSNPDGWNDTGKIGCSYSCPITLACFDITSAGHYELNNDIVADKDPCININARDVVLDCKGYRIIGNSNFNGTAIHQAGQENVTIVNCSIIGFNYGYYGEPYISQSGLGRSINLTLSNNEFKNVSYGIYSLGQKDVKIENNYVDAFTQGISITYSSFIPENYLIINNTVEDQIRIIPRGEKPPEFPPSPPPTIGILAEDVKNLTLKYNKVRNFTYGIKLVNSSYLAIEEIKYNVGCKNKETDIVAERAVVAGINVDNNYCNRASNFNDYNTSGCKKNPMLREIYDYFNLYLDYQYLNLSHPVSIISLSKDNLSDLTPYINAYSSLNYENWTKLEELETDIRCSGTCMPIQGCNPLTRKPAICMSEPHCNNFVYDDFGNCRCLEPVNISVNGPYASCSNQSLVDYKFYKIIAENFCDEKEVVYARHTLRLIKPSINKTGINLIPITTHLDNKTVVGIFDYETNKGVGLREVFVPIGIGGTTPSPPQPYPQITAEHLTSEISNKLKNSGMNVELRYLSYWNASLQAYVGHPAQTFAHVYVKDFEVKEGKPYYIDVNKNITFTLFGKLWWPVEANIEYHAPLNSSNDIILPLNTSIKNLRQLCDIGFVNQSERVRYWDAVRQNYMYYHPAICKDASESMLVEAGKPYVVEVNQSWKGVIP